jgi:hypothetical protein
MKEMHLKNFKLDKVVEATSWFTKTGPSPNPPPATSPEHMIKSGTSSDAAQSAQVLSTPTTTAAVTKAPQIKSEDGDDDEADTPFSQNNATVDLSGVWNRIRVHNVDSYVGRSIFNIYI